MFDVTIIILCGLQLTLLYAQKLLSLVSMLSPRLDTNMFCQGKGRAGGHHSVVEHWQLKPGVMGSIPVTTSLSLSSISPHNVQVSLFPMWDMNVIIMFMWSVHKCRSVNLLGFSTSHLNFNLQASFVFGKGCACTEDEKSFTLEAILRPNCQWS